MIKINLNYSQHKKTFGIAIIFLVVLIIFTVGFWKTQGFGDHLGDYLSQYHQKALFSSSFIPSYNQSNYPLVNLTFDTQPKITAKSVLIYDASSKDILYQKNIEKSRPIASLAKLMTAMVVIDNINNLDKKIIVDQESLNKGYGRIGQLEIGEKISIKNLLYELLMVSSNDAAYLLANTVYQEKYQNFVKLMNQKSRSLGLEKTVFTDPSGYASTTVSTAKESLKIFERALQYPLIRKIIHTQKYSFATFSGRKKHNIHNSNHLFKKIPTMIGGKTGFTDEAGETFVFAFQEPHHQHIIYISTLGSKIGYRFIDAMRLYNWLEKKYIF
ncbi:MAG TPA: D-alanyl-D-alanine carboxypeptidase [Candidatus Portnoybacteria bacterium]|nr:D-alanyl-D-alanine carboxypeptidase [Candidatus Portnoybacteria bacterium]